MQFGISPPRHSGVEHPPQLDPPWYFVVVCPLTEGLTFILRLAEEVVRPIVL
jgi:hypothetical protein